MFSGIIESLGRIEGIKIDGRNKHYTIHSNLCKELKVDQSVAHNGVCLTVVDVNDHSYTVTAVEETLNVSNIGSLQTGDQINLERSIRLSDRLDGHIVQGHVDAISTLMKVEEEDGSWRFKFSIPPSSAGLLVYKGSICINGVSLTIAGLDLESFDVAIIPFTFENTNFKHLSAGDKVNIEFDILGKYILRNLNLNK